MSKEFTEVLPCEQHRAELRCDRVACFRWDMDVGMVGSYRIEPKMDLRAYDGEHCGHTFQRREEVLRRENRIVDRGGK